MGILDRVKKLEELERRTVDDDYCTLIKVNPGETNLEAANRWLAVAGKPSLPNNIIFVSWR